MLGCKYPRLTKVLSLAATQEHQARILRYDGAGSLGENFSSTGQHMFPGSISARSSTILLAASLLALTLAAPSPLHAAKKPAAKEVEETQTLSGPAMMAVVSLRDQRISVYDAHGGAMRARVSSGQTDYETPVGIYSILQKNKDHYSNLYDDAEMPFMQRLTWSGIALHAGALPGHPASHGCVRMPHGFAEQLFPLSKIGTRVIVARDDVAPVEITHPLLWKPTVTGIKAAAIPIAYEQDETQDPGGKPFRPDLRNWPEREALFEQLKTASDAKAIEAQALVPPAEELKKPLKAKTSARAKTAKALKRAESAKRQTDDWSQNAARRLANAKTDKAKKSAEQELAKATAAVAKADEKLTAAKADDQTADAELKSATDAFNAADAKRAAAASAADEARRKTLPVSVFVSLKTQQLYVRQGHEQVLEAPVTIANPETPIGTHIYTTLDYKDDGNDVLWNVVSLRPRASSDIDDPFADDELRRDNRKRHAATTSSAVPPPTDLGPATAALDRITLPPEVAARVSQYVWPGSSLIISDEAASKETGKSTDFVVLISGEPQGGIKKRPRPQPDYYRYDRYYSDDYYYNNDRYYNDRYYNDRRRKPRYTPFFSFW